MDLYLRIITSTCTLVSVKALVPLLWQGTPEGSHIWKILLPLLWYRKGFRANITLLAILWSRKLSTVFSEIAHIKKELQLCSITCHDVSSNRLSFQSALFKLRSYTIGMLLIFSRVPLSKFVPFSSIIPCSAWERSLPSCFGFVEGIEGKTSSVCLQDGTSLVTSVSQSAPMWEMVIVYPNACISTPG